MRETQLAISWSGTDDEPKFDSAGCQEQPGYTADEDDYDTQEVDNQWN